MTKLHTNILPLSNDVNDNKTYTLIIFPLKKVVKDDKKTRQVHAQNLAQRTSIRYHKSEECDIRRTKYS